MIFEAFDCLKATGAFFCEKSKHWKTKKDWMKFIALEGNRFKAFCF